MSKKIHVAILFGGKSAEHEVSLRSAKSIIGAIDKNKYEITLIGIDKEGKWFWLNKSDFISADGNQKIFQFKKASNSAALLPGEGGWLTLDGKKKSKIDVVFPVLHGALGEDGTVQGLLKLADMPFVGAGVMGSSVGMDKDAMKKVLRDAQIPIGKFLVFSSGDKINFRSASKELGLPIFVKPANTGSSVGVSKCRNEKEFKLAVKNAFTYDRKIVVEQFIKGREIECSVLGNENPTASLPGEVIPQHDFYSYEAKYLDENGAKLQIPAKLPKNIIKKIQEASTKAYQALYCEGFGRVDMFLTSSGKIYINEINTIPGFTSISMYPKLWEASGLKYPDLIDELIQLAMERFKKDKKLKTSFIN